MHTETDEEVRMHQILRDRMTGIPAVFRAPRVYSNFKPERGTIGEYDKMKTDTAEFKQALRRQLPPLDYNRMYSRVEQHCRKHRPFANKPYRDWLGVLQAVWSRALAGELPAMPGEFHSSGVQYRDIAKLEAVASQEKPVKTKAVKQPKAPKITHNIVGVRFVRGHNVEKVYSYTVPKKVKLHLGEEVVVPSYFDGFEANTTAVVVALNHTPEYAGQLKQVYGRITPVKG